MWPENLKCRTATNADIPEIVELVKQCLPEFNLTFSPETSERDLQNIEATYLNQGGTFEIIQSAEGKIIGTVALLRVNATTAKLRKMYLAKDYRSLGLGRLLLERILEKAISLGYQEILLETVHTMKTAIHLYESFGFRKVNQVVAVSPRCDIVMRKILTDRSKN
ncbi:MAG: GNAT family N-acetyltransferase [Bacteroidota bacterium]|nr:GNAT family N-acetyltransferase [Bacteroidota bacterium]